MSDAAGDGVAGPTLRQRLLWHVLVPVTALWLLSTALVIEVAYVYTQRAFDRALLDDAYALSAHVRDDGAGQRLELSARELDSVLFDQSEKVFFAVQSADGRTLASNAPWLLRATPSAAGSESRSGAYVLADRYHEGDSLRVVDLALGDGRGGRIVLAQTVRSRTRLVQQMLLYTVLPEALLLVLLGGWLWRAIGGDLAPLKRLQEALGARDMRDLSPVATVASPTRDVAQVTQALNALFARVEAGVAAQREFAGNVAHELRTPLAGIRALADYGLRQPDAAVWRAQLEAIRARQEDASHLIDQLLALAFADEARDTLALADLDLVPIIERAVVAALPRIDARGGDISVHGLDGPISVHGNEGLLLAMLGNLIDNAARHAAPPAGVPLAIALVIDAAGDDAHVDLAVLDNGAGLGEALPTVPARWAHVGDTGAGSAVAGTGGTGLGLAIVTRYAELLGARLLLEPTNGGGLRARIRLRRGGALVAAGQPRTGVVR